MATKNLQDDEGEDPENYGGIQNEPEKLQMVQEDLDPFIKGKINRLKVDNLKYDLDKELNDQISNTDENGTVTLVYPTSHISLLSTSDDRLVNLVEFSNIEGVGSHLELDGTTYNLLSQGFENDSQISIMATDAPETQLQFLQSGDESGFYHHTSSSNSKAPVNSILPEQLLQLPSGEVIDSSSNISLPLSLVTKGNSVLQGLSTIPVTLSYEGSGSSQVLGSRQPTTISYDVNLENTNKLPEKPSQTIIKKEDIDKPLVKSLGKPTLAKKHRTGQVGRPPKQETCNKIIGSGPTAISAEGVIHSVGNRLVTVLPRPEDVERLVASKKLVMKLKRNGSRTSLLNKSAKKGKISTTGKQDVFNAKSDSSEMPSDQRPRVCLKQYKKRGRKRKGKTPRCSFVVSSGGKRPGRPRKVQTLLGGPNGPRIIHTGPDRPPSEGIGSEPNENSHGNIENNLENPRKVAEFDFFSEDLSTKVLPPRRRGTRYQEMLQAIKASETEEASISSDENEDISKGLHEDNSPIVYHQKSDRKRFHGKGFARGMESNYDDGGTRIIQLGENLNPIETSSSSKILVEEGQDFGKSAEKFMFSFEQSADESMNEDCVEKSIDSKNDLVEMQINEDATTNISVLKNSAGHTEHQLTTIFVKEELSVDERFECGECKRLCDSKEEYCEHMTQDHGLETFECTDCGKLFMAQHELNAHQASHECLDELTCEICQEIFTSVELLKSHRASHSSQKYSCSRCSAIFDNVPDLNFHLRKMECMYDGGESVEKVFVCDICKASFVASSGLNKHRKVHRLGLEDSLNKYKCTICHANFTYKESLEEHIKMVHENPLMGGEGSAKEEVSMIVKLQEKLNEGYAPKNSELYDVPQASEIADQKNTEPFLCGVCDEAFVDIDLLCDHGNNCHTANQPFSCEFCGVGCSSQEQLDRHKMVHEEEERKAALPGPDDCTSWICTYCGKRFMKSQDLEKHTKLHTQEKTYKCQVCDASFLLKSTLEKHKLVHTGHRPYVCDICLKSFRQSASLIRHKLWTHSLKNQNKCSICFKTFFTANLLIHHLGTHGEAGEKEIKEVEERMAHKADENAEKSTTQETDSSESKSFQCEYCDKVCGSMVALLSHKLIHKRSNSYCCVDCNRTFREKRYLKKHRLTHRGVKSWKCNICSKAFATKLTLIRHSQVHIRESLRPDLNISLVTEDSTAVGSSLPSILECEECNRTFDHKSHYVRHKLLHSGVALLKCGICDRLFVHKSDLIRHKVMHSLMFSCNICGRNFHKRSLYLIHKKRHLDGRPFKCEKCKKSFSSAGNYMVHLRTHSGEKPYKCNICNYRCAQSGRLKRHKRMHYSLKSYPCDICNKTFATMESAASHKLIHSEHRPFTCKLCPKGFYNKNSLNQHLREHVREQEYSCTMCPHKFRREEHLIKHKMFHEKSFEGELVASSSETSLFMCDKCGRVFDKKKYLYTHQNIHSNSNKFQCDSCSKVLGSRVGLKNHMMIHSGQMPFTCETCGKEFRTISNLNRHKKSHARHACDICSVTFEFKYELDEHRATHLDVEVPPEEPAEPPPQQMYVFVDDGMETGGQQLLVENNQQFLVNGSQSILVFPETRYTDIAENTQSTSDMKIESVATDSMEPEAEYLIPKASPSPSIATPPDSVPKEPILKPHECDVCHKTFAKKQYLTKHKYRHRQVKPHECQVCHKTFAQKFEVAVHMMKHTGARPFRCDVCQKDFRSRANLVNHKMRHTGEYPYMCSICDKGLSTQLQLEKHVSLHTGAYPHSCPHCSRGFSTSSSLNKHIYKCHQLEMNPTTDEQLESLEAVANIPQEEKSEMLSFIKKEKEQEIGINVQNIDISAMSELEDSAFSVQVQNPYLKNCILEGQTDIEQKFLSSILHQDEESCNSDNNEVNLSLLSTDLDAT